MNSKEHFILGFHELVTVDGQTRFNEFSKDPKELHFAKVGNTNFPGDYSLNKFDPMAAAEIMDQLIPKENGKSRNVLIHFHGFRARLLINLPGGDPLGLKLLKHQAKSYFKHQKNLPLKLVFFAWPAIEKANRYIADDNGYELGQTFMENGLWTKIEAFSDELAERDIHLNLMVHSFGHHFLNGIFSKFTDENIGKKLFAKVFLMASDIPQQCLQINTGKENGISVPNNFCAEDNTCQNINYDLTPLGNLSDKVHVFYDKYDYLLYVSIRKQIEIETFEKKAIAERKNEILKYITLGNSGRTHFGQVPSNFVFHDIKDFKFKPKVKKNIRKAINKFHNKYSFESINDKATFLVRNLVVTKRHRYFFSSESVAKKVLQLMK